MPGYEPVYTPFTYHAVRESQTRVHTLLHTRVRDTYPCNTGVNPAFVQKGKAFVFGTRIMGGSLVVLLRFPEGSGELGTGNEGTSSLPGERRGGTREGRRTPRFRV